VLSVASRRDLCIVMLDVVMLNVVAPYSLFRRQHDRMIVKGKRRKLCKQTNATFFQEKIDFILDSVAESFHIVAKEVDGRTCILSCQGLERLVMGPVS